MRLRLAALMIGGFASCGCGPDGPQVAPASGSVMVDGRPVANAQVMFVPTTGRPAAGVTDESGRFKLSTYQTTDGAIVGAHRVTITSRRPIRVDSGPEMKVGPALSSVSDQPWQSPVPEQYSDPKSSGLEATVEIDGPNDFKFDLTRKQ